MKLSITGGKKLSGTVRVGGSKNAVLPLIAAALLVKGKTVLENVPDILDVHNMLEIVSGLGVTYAFANNRLELDATRIAGHVLPRELVARMRGSILLVGPLLARLRKVETVYPGGDLIGARTIEPHLEGFTALGATRQENEDMLLELPQYRAGTVVLSETSVTATENLVMFMSLFPETSQLRLAATEPHVQTLCRFLERAGARIEGIGTPFLTITGADELKSITFPVPPDDIEIVTFAILGAATHSAITVLPVDPAVLDAFFLQLRSFGVEFHVESDRLILEETTKPYKACRVQTGLFPKLATDYQSLFGVLATQAQGVTLIHDWLYEGRLNYLLQLKKMGANAEILDVHRAIIIGPTPLYGKEVESLDIRSGAALVIAGLVAQGKTTINEAEKINRGYEGIVEKLKGIGADVSIGQ